MRVRVPEGNLEARRTGGVCVERALRERLRLC